MTNFRTLSKRFARSAALLGAVALGVPAALAAEPAMSPEEAAVLQALDDALPGELLHNPMAAEWDTRGEVRTKIVDAPTLTTGQAIQAKVKGRADNVWDTVLGFEIPGGVKKGETVEIYYFVRTEKAIKGRDSAKVSIFLGRNEEPYDYIIAEPIEPGPEWKMQSAKAVAKADFPEGEIKLEYQLAYGKQVVEFGPAYISVLGR